MKIRVLEKISLQQKILLTVIGTSFIVFFLAIGFIAIKTRENSLRDGVASMTLVAEKNAVQIKSSLEKDLFIARTLSNSIQSHKLLPVKKWKEVFANMYEETLKNNPEILSVWDSWELNYIDSSYTKEYGRYECLYWRENGQIKHTSGLNSLTGDSPDYARIKKEKTESLEDPYFYSYESNKLDQFLMTSIIVSNVVNNRFIGVVGIDIALSRYYDMVNLIRPYDNSYAMLISNNLNYVSHPQKEKIGTSFLNDFESIFQKSGKMDNLFNGDGFFFSSPDINGVNSYFTVKPINVGNSNLSWALILVVPVNEITRSANANLWTIFVMLIIGLIVLSSFTYYFSKYYIISPIERIHLVLDRLSKGNITQDMYTSTIDHSDEMGRIITSLNNSISGLFQKVDFAGEIGKGNLNANLSLLGDEDLLGKSLINMQESLLHSQKEDNLRKIEDEKRKWANEGLARFSEFLRQNNDKLDLFASEIIKNLVHYLNANQGGLFLLNDEDQNNSFFDLLAAYAFNRQKFMKKQVLLGEGLIGACAIEKKSIYITEIPEKYIQISSGLGEARPRSLLIVPLMVDEKVLGVIEIASFHEIEQYQMEFVEKIAQSIASTLISVRTNIKTTALLAKTQQQAEEMLAQEEEVRQNLEEMETIKEDLEKRNQQFEENQRTLAWEKMLMDALLNYIPDKIYFKDLNSKFIKGSKSFLEFFGAKTQEEIEGKSDFDYFDDEHARPAYEDEQRIIRTDIPIIGLVEKEVMSDGRVFWGSTSKMPLKDSEGKTIGTFGITRDITDTKKSEIELQVQYQYLQDLQESLAKEKMLLDTLLDNIPDFIYFKDIECRFIRISQSMVALFQADSPNELVGKSDFDFHSHEHAQKAYKEEHEIMEGKKRMVDEIVHEQFDDGRQQWVSTTKMPLYNQTGEVVGVWGISKIVTDLKKAEIEAIARAQEAEKLRAEISIQEIELLKKVKELQTAHEEANNKSIDMKNYIEALNNSSFVIEYDLEGNVIFINDRYLKLLGVSRKSVIGTHHSYKMDFSKEQKMNYNKFWNDLKKGIPKKVINKIVINEKSFTFEETYTPLRNAQSEVFKIIKIANNITQLGQ